MFYIEWLTLGLLFLTGITAGLDALWRRYHPLAPAAHPYGFVALAHTAWPLLLFIVALRAWVVEPFRIPSESMMPTLNVGDYIAVTKFDYDLRLPGVYARLMSTGSPQRGDVVVFRFPGYWCSLAGHWQRSGDWSCQQPNTPVPHDTWIKRVIGLPGDRVAYHNGQLFINGQAVTLDDVHPYPDDLPPLKAHHLQPAVEAQERLGSMEHLLAHTQSAIPVPDLPNAHNPEVVPPDCYLVMGDNRENSVDSRWWGCVPRANLVGKARWVLVSHYPVAHRRIS